MFWLCAMTEMYLILGCVGWIWLVIVVAFASGYFKGQRDGQRNRQEVIGKNEKQS
jgi:hypothetical protein